MAPRDKGGRRKGYKEWCGEVCLGDDGEHYIEMVFPDSRYVRLNGRDLWQLTQLLKEAYNEP